MTDRNPFLAQDPSTAGSRQTFNWVEVTLVAGAAFAANAIVAGALGNAFWEWVRTLHVRGGEERIAELKEGIMKELRKAKRQPQAKDSDLQLRVDQMFREHGF
ncbi:MAG: hypothetical protein GY711_14470 [bacterium]|nr:hypothetical protein [bacterium]